MATKTEAGSYAIIALGGKQYVVREGERLLVDRVGTDEGKTFHPDILFLGGEGTGQLAPKSQVTARVVGHVLGEKVRIGKYRPKSGYKRHTGFRAKLTQIEIESIGGGAERAVAASAAPKQEAPAPQQEAPAAKPKEAPAAAAQLPSGYANLTVVEISEKAKRWKLESLEAALAHEQEQGQRKGAIATLESAIAAKKEN